MGIESVIKVGRKALTQVAKKAYVKPMCEVKTLESIGLEMQQLTDDLVQFSSRAKRNVVKVKFKIPELVEAIEPYKTLLVKPSDKKLISKHFYEYLNKEELEAFNVYYETYGNNHYLRMGQKPNILNNIMDSGFKKAPELHDDAVVYRGLERLRLKSSQRFIDSIEEGRTITDTAYMSTSTSLTQLKNTIFIDDAIKSNGIVLRIHLPKGTKGVLMNYNEYLLPRNSQLKIDKITTSKGVKIADCTYILPNNTKSMV